MKVNTLQPTKFGVDTQKTEDLLKDFYHYKALYDYYNEEGEDTRKIELILRKIEIELRKRNAL